MVLWALSLAVGLGAALLCAPINRFLAKCFHRAVVWLLPVVEETVKTGAAVLLSVSVPLVHLGFGIAELAFDVLTGKSGASFGLVAAAAVHWVFGLVTVAMFQALDSVVLAVLAAATIHGLWNLIAWQGSNN